MEWQNIHCVRGFIVSLIILLATATSLTADSKEASETGCLTSFFTKSLHYTGEGMRRWYEADNGFMQITGIPYDQLNCKSCHVKSCDQCHLKKKRAKSVFKRSKAKDMNTCMPCHGREGLTFKFDGERGQLDVHVASGMVCADCHRHYDVHGDGRFRSSMRDQKGVRADCRTCHIDSAGDSPEFDPDTESHSVHGTKLDCSACHVQNTTACYNCHFERYLETGRKKGNYIPMQDWLLLINYNGQITSGSVMSLVYQNKKFLAYVPYFTHSVTAAGRQCEDCHANPAVRAMQQGKKVKVVDFKKGKTITWKGVVPVADGKLDWVFLNRTDSGWEKIESADEPTVQYAAYGRPLTDEQMHALYEEQRIADSK
ncbi:MAG: hypothetical protein JJV98_15240 [Desulfosarcina sp.]|nr:hypothetical protein [Desulfobacterales bacterium]